MKNKFLAIILFFLLLVCPIYANTSYTITLNGIAYIPQDTLYALDKTLYISADDFTSLTYSAVTSESNSTLLTIQNHTLKFTANERIASINGKVTILVNMPLMLNDQLYLPISLLDYINYPYTLSNKNFTLTLDALMPYSKATDPYDDHLLMNTKIDDLSVSLEKLTSKEAVVNLLKEAKKYGDYISFIDHTDKESLLSLIKSDLLKGKPLQVAFREIDLLAASPKVGALKQMPVKLTVDSDNLVANIGNDVFSYNCIWAATMPSDIPLKIDVTKSLDATLMRMLYEYYRDQNDLKDDLYFSPIMTIKNTRSNSVHYRTYSDHIISQENAYDVIIYKTIDENQMTYVVDFILQASK